VKKVILCVLLIFGVCFSAFSLQETWFSIGIPFGNHFERGTSIENIYMGSLGGSLSVYEFFNRGNIGLFVNFGFYYPVIINTEIERTSMFHYDLTLGPGFRHNINERLDLHFGIGFLLQRQFMTMTICGRDTIDTRLGFGIGGDVGLKLDLTDAIFLSVGSLLNYNFASRRTVLSTMDNWDNTRRDFSGWIGNYHMFGIRPYVAIGINYHRERGPAQLGRPFFR